jgi:hypothetical protein
MGLETVKPMASLSAGLLARKGAARPGQKYMAEPGLEIPENHRVIRFGGLNDDEDVPAPDVHEPFADNDLSAQHYEAVTEVVAPVVVAPAVIAAPVLVSSFVSDPVVATPVAVLPQVVVTQPKQRRAAGSRSKAAFTLRLDAERHLRLRLLSAHQHRSAQRIILDAVDQLLAETFEPLLASGRLAMSVAKEQCA